METQEMHVNTDLQTTAFVLNKKNQSRHKSGDLWTPSSLNGGKKHVARCW